MATRSRPPSPRGAPASSATRAATPMTPAATPAARAVTPAIRAAVGSPTSTAGQADARSSTDQALAAARPPDSEKITINLGFVDLGQIDLLVTEGFYGNRTDLIRTAIRNLLAGHSEAVRQVIARRTFVLGLQHFDAQQLRSAVDAGHKLQIRVLGLATFGADVTPALAVAAIDSIEVLGALRMAPAIRTALAGRIR